MIENPKKQNVFSQRNNKRDKISNNTIAKTSSIARKNACPLPVM